MISLITLQLGNDVMVAVQAEMQRAARATRALVEEINRIERAMQGAVPGRALELLRAGHQATGSWRDQDYATPQAPGIE